METCHKHVMLVMYVRKNKIRSMGNKEMEKKERMCVIVSPPIAVSGRKENKKKSVHPLVHPWPKILRKKEGVLASCLVWKRIRRRFGHTCI